MSDTVGPGPRVETERYASPLTLGNKVGRVLWGVARALLFRPTPRRAFGWRRLLLRAFGARLGRGVHVYPSAEIWAPWNLEMGDHATIADRVDCYSVGTIRIGANATVSQYAHLCAATHDIEDPRLALVIRPITIGASAWVCAGAFVGPGVTVGEGAVVGARAVAVRDVPPWTVVAGNPARTVKTRTLRTGPR